MTGLQEFEVNTTSGMQVPLENYKDKVLLIVNTASKCGFTPQFTGLEALYSELHEEGLEILGFTCNQFLKKDPASDSEISEFFSLNHGVTFPMFSKI